MSTRKTGSTDKKSVWARARAATAKQQVDQLQRGIALYGEVPKKPSRAKMQAETKRLKTYCKSRKKRLADEKKDKAERKEVGAYEYLQKHLGDGFKEWEGGWNGACGHFEDDGKGNSVLVQGTGCGKSFKCGEPQLRCQHCNFTACMPGCGKVKNLGLRTRAPNGIYLCDMCLDDAKAVGWKDPEEESMEEDEDDGSPFTVDLNGPAVHPAQIMSWDERHQKCILGSCAKHVYIFHVDPNNPEVCMPKEEGGVLQYVQHATRHQTHHQTRH